MAHRHDTWPMVESCLVFLKEHATATARSTNGRQAADLVAALKGGKLISHGADNAALDPAIVWTALDLLLLDPCCNLFLFPPSLYPALVSLLSGDDAPDLDQVKDLLHKPSEPTKQRFFFALHVLHDIWTRTQSNTTDCVDRFAPLLFRDGVSAVRSINHVQDMHATKKCLALVLHHLEFMARDDTAIMFDALVRHTVRSVLFEPPVAQGDLVKVAPLQGAHPACIGASDETTPEKELPVVQDRHEAAAVKLQALVRGWLCRRWCSLALLYTLNRSNRGRPGGLGPRVKGHHYRRQYLALTKQVLLWPVDKLQRDKARVKTQLKAFDDQFQVVHGRRPRDAAEKEPMRQLYELYHFLGLIMDYQRTDTADGPSNEVVLVDTSPERIEATKERLQMRLILFERHFELCCGERVQNEDDYGHVLSSYNQYKTLTSALAQNQEPHD